MDGRKKVSTVTNKLSVQSATPKFGIHTPSRFKRVSGPKNISLKDLEMILSLNKERHIFSKQDIVKIARHIIHILKTKRVRFQGLSQTVLVIALSRLYLSNEGIILANHRYATSHYIRSVGRNIAHQIINYVPKPPVKDPEKKEPIPPEKPKEEPAKKDDK